MERNTNIPHARGDFDITQMVTGPIVEIEGAQDTVDDLFRKACHDIHKNGIAAIRSLESSLIEPDTGTTETDVILEIEALGNQVALRIHVKLGYIVDEEFVRAMVLGHTLPEFTRMAVEIISERMMGSIAIDESRIRWAPRQPTSIADLLGSAAIVSVPR